MTKFDDDFMIVATAFLTAVASELDPHTDDKGRIRESSSTNVALYEPEYIQFAKYGRGPGKKPPLDPILAWVRKNGVNFGHSTERGTAFAIQKWIGEHGTKNFVVNAPDAIGEAVEKYVSQFEDDLSRTMVKSIELEIYSTLENMHLEKVIII